MALVGKAALARHVGQTDTRLKEAAKLGFARAVIPARRGGKAASGAAPAGLKVDQVDHLRELIDRLGGE